MKSLGQCELICKGLGEPTCTELLQGGLVDLFSYGKGCGKCYFCFQLDLL